MSDLIAHKATPTSSSSFFFFSWFPGLIIQGSGTPRSQASGEVYLQRSLYGESIAVFAVKSFPGESEFSQSCLK